MSGDIVERLRYAAWLNPSEGETADAYYLAADALDEIERLRAEVERLQDKNATLRRNEWRLIWGLCTECGANRDKEARRG